MLEIFETKIFAPPLIWAQIQIAGLQISQSTLLDFIKAVLSLIVGFIIAVVAKSIVKGLLSRTDVDNKIAGWVGPQEEGQGPPIERWIGNLVFWTILLFTLVAFLDALKLHVVSEPLNSLLEQITRFLPQLLGAACLLGLAWLVATVTKMLVIKGFKTFRVEERLGLQGNERGAQNQLSIGETIGNALFWFILLLFLPSILSTLNLQGSLGPVQNLLNQILDILPKALGAIIIGAVGWFIAQIVRQVVTNLLAVTGIDSFGAKLGLDGTQGKQSLSWIIGTITYVLVLIPTTIAALNALQIRAISDPAVNMLDRVLNLLPKLFAAGIVLALAYAAGRYVAELVTSVLTGIGFNDILNLLGISSPTAKVGQTTVKPDSGQNTVLQTEQNTIRTTTPSELVGTITLVAIMLVAALTAVDILQIDALKKVVGIVLVIAGQVLLGLIVFAIGLYLANLAYKLVASSGSRQAKMLAQTARVAILALVGAMALQQMGVAPSIVNLAFGLLLGGIAVALSLAFGLGGREAAGEQVREWLSSFKKE
jgi:hypothetical protein